MAATSRLGVGVVVPADEAVGRQRAPPLAPARDKHHTPEPDETEAPHERKPRKQAKDKKGVKKSAQSVAADKAKRRAKHKARVAAMKELGRNTFSKPNLGKLGAAAAVGFLCGAVPYVVNRVCLGAPVQALREEFGQFPYLLDEVDLLVALGELSKLIDLADTRAQLLPVFDRNCALLNVIFGHERAIMDMDAPLDFGLVQFLHRAQAEHKALNEQLHALVVSNLSTLPSDVEKELEQIEEAVDGSVKTTIVNFRLRVRAGRYRVLSSAQT